MASASPVARSRRFSRNSIGLEIHWFITLKEAALAYRWFAHSGKRTAAKLRWKAPRERAVSLLCRCRWHQPLSSRRFSNSGLRNARNMKRKLKFNEQTNGGPSADRSNTGNSLSKVAEPNAA